jgi:hypothetical protein
MRKRFLDKKLIVTDIFIFYGLANELQFISKIYWGAANFWMRISVPLIPLKSRSAFEVHILSGIRTPGWASLQILRTLVWSLQWSAVMKDCLPQNSSVPEYFTQQRKSNQIKWVDNTAWNDYSTVSLRCFHRAFLLNYSLKCTNNNAQVRTLCDPKVLRGPPLLLHVSVACLPSSSGNSHLEAAKPLVGYRPFTHTHTHTHIIYSDIQQFPWSSSDYVCEKRRYPTSGVVASKCELPHYGGKHATEICRSKGGPLRTLGSHRVKTCALYWYPLAKNIIMLSHSMSCGFSTLSMYKWQFEGICCLLLLCWSDMQKLCGFLHTHMLNWQFLNMQDKIHFLDNLYWNPGPSHSAVTFRVTGLQ